MNEAKTGFIGVYVLLLLAACVLPFALLHPQAGRLHRKSRIGLVLGIVLAIGDAALLAARGFPGLMSPLVLSIAFVVPLAKQGRAMLLGGLAALPLLATVFWWAPDLELGPTRCAAFLLLGAAAAALPSLFRRRQGVPVLPALLAMLVPGIAVMLLTGTFAVPMGFWALWHHWSVYISAAESFLAGAVPFRDFPVQYGIGPMLVVAALCNDECWTGMYVAVAASNLLYLTAMSGCVVALTRLAPRGIALLALTAIGCTILLWTGYPPDFLGPMVTPSVAGLRFMPLAALLLFIILTETREVRGDIAGHGLWLMGLVWSPEAAFYSTAVWWPYLGLRRAQFIGATRTTTIALAALRGGGAALIALAIGIGLLALTFRFTFGEWPSLLGFSTYIRNPPGILPVNALGPIWLALSGVVIGVIALSRSDARGLRTGFACLMGLIAVGSYYLGRSHDNNALNLFPFVVLMLTAALAERLPDVPAGFARIVLAGLVALPATFGTQTWTAAWRAGNAGNLGPARLVEHVHFSTSDSWGLLDAWLAGMEDQHAPAADAGAALNWLREVQAGPPLWVNGASLLPYWAPGAAWTGMSDLGSYALLPPAEIERFILNGAQTLHRPGWILVDRTQPDPWLALFAKAYEVTEERTFGGYTAYRLAPR